MEIIIVLALAAIIFGPRTLWRMRRRRQGRSEKASSAASKLGTGGRRAV